MFSVMIGGSPSEVCPSCIIHQRLLGIYATRFNNARAFTHLLFTSWRWKRLTGATTVFAVLSPRSAPNLPSALFNGHRETGEGLTRSGFASHEVLLAEEARVVEQVELLASGQLTPAESTGETAQVVHLVARLAHQVRRRQSLPAAAAFRTVSPVQRVLSYFARILQQPSLSFQVHVPDAIAVAPKEAEIYLKKSVRQ